MQVFANDNEKHATVQIGHTAEAPGNAPPLFFQPDAVFAVFFKCKGEPCTGIGEFRPY